MADIKRVIIVGGGTAGWMTAAALGNKLENLNISIELIESDQIGTVGVGEATLPHIRLFNASLGINEAEFMRETSATIKLGIQFCDWGKIGDRYIHPFGDYGLPIKGVDFYQHWLKHHQQGALNTRLDEYSMGIMAAENNKFRLPEQGQSEIETNFGFAYQFDATLYAKFLRKYAESKGVTRTEAKIVNVRQDPHTDAITSVQLDNGKEVEGDFFVDCSGFKGLLIEQTLKAGYDNWSHWLPCNRAVAVACETSQAATPYTRATARAAGWQWRIPLQHRVGNGYVYWNEHISDDEACHQLLSSLEGKPLTDPNQLYFTTGMRKKSWVKNVVAIGLSSGFLEPLESTSIHLIQESITMLVRLFPQQKCNELDSQEFNDYMQLQYERVRDFLLLHYTATQRDDSAMWRYFNTMTLPDSLQTKIDLWLSRGYVQRYEFGAFLPPSWVAVMLGQNLMPTGYDPRVDTMPPERFLKLSEQLRQTIQHSVQRAPRHLDFLKQYGAAANSMSSVSPNLIKS